MIKAYAALEANGKLQPFEYDPGALGANEVEIEVRYCGVCHSDLSMINNEWGISNYPLVPGHEVVGTVAAMGEGVNHVEVGDLVGLGWHAGYCMTCHSCLSGYHNLCATAESTIVGHYGGFGDRVRAKGVSVVKLPKDIDLASAGPLFCGGITVFSPMVEFGLKPTAKVAVIGIGGLGHLAVQFLRAWGCEVTAFTSSARKQTEALELGAHHILDSTNPEAIASAEGKFDYIISTVNLKLDWNLYISTLAPQGHFHFVGVVLEPLDLSLFPLLMGQRSIAASPVGSPATIATMLDFAVRHNIKPVVEEFSFDQINEAIAHLENGKAHYRVVLSHGKN
ncbi:NADPH-dependent aldehyde reductase Ahr [Synechocystis sp. CACIAM 05]|uniref:NADPH-dependent aldehyde reductase Ahr n=1 Tax=Synechocystis sp. CACIAM 05 TaxID=1933929 RepID=UPI00138E5966|nr:NAD(P)-dependent alcohol dehydrogenase [Synechocystis sp. CACIAM 05]QHV01539.1 alcohol dehydrogenase [Synechocystis sp. CACIAM 05]